MGNTWKGSNSDDYTTEQLAVLIQKSDRRAFDYVYRLYAAVFYGQLLRALKNEQRAQNCLIEVFVTIWKQLTEAVSLPTSLHRYIQDIATRTCLKYTCTQNSRGTS